MQLRFTDADRLRVAEEFGAALAAGGTLASKVGLLNEIVERRVGGVKFTFLHHETRTGKLLDSFYFNFDRHYVDIYADHFSRLNPWVAFWASQPNGAIRASEEARPSSSFHRSEFFADYLRPQGDMNAAAGMKLQSAAGSITHFAWHYPERHAEALDRLFTEVLTQTRDLFMRTIAMARDCGEVDNRRPEEAFAHHANAAMTLDDDGVIVERNDRAERILGEQRICRISEGKLAFVNDNANARFHELFIDMRFSAKSYGARLLCGGEHAVSVRVYRLSGTRAEGRVLISRPARWLAFVAERTNEADFRRFESVRQGFDLTQREFELCCAIASGTDLATISAQTGLSIGTLRIRLKEIFRKTYTNRQAELVALLHQLF